MDQKITIDDFKLFEHQSISLRNLTILAGVNSVGKSTIIQALLLLRSTIEESHKFEKEIKRFPVALNGPFNLQLGNTVEVIRRTKRLGDSSMRLTISNIENDPIIFVGYIGDRSTQTNYQLWVEDCLFSGESVGLLHPHFYYLCAERIGPRLKYEYDILPFLHAGYQGENTFQVLSGENISVDRAKSLDDEENGFILGEARKWLDYIIPGANFESAIAVGRSRVIEGTFAESLPTNVGFGISYVLPIIVNGLLAEPNAFFIVENPEAHLHPLGQSRIGKFLAQISGVGVQVVVETHSEHVINGARIASLIGKVDPKKIIVNYLSETDTHEKTVTEIDVTYLGDLTSYPKGFFDQEQADIARLIKEKRKITKHES